MKTNYSIGTLDKGGAMTKTFTPVAGDYESAKRAAIAAWKERPMSLPTVHSGSDLTFYYFRIDRDGSWIDRNTVPSTSGKL